MKKSAIVDPGLYEIIFVDQSNCIVLVAHDLLRQYLHNWVTTTVRGRFEGTSMSDVRFVAMNYDPNDLQGIVNNQLLNAVDEVKKPGAGTPEAIYPFGGKYYPVPESKKCECGSSAVGSDRHADYCPLYKKL